VKRSLRRFLRRRGASEVEIENAERNRYLTLLVLDRAIIPGARRYTADQIAAAAGTDVGTARAVWRAIGFPDLADELPAFTEADLKTLRAFVARFQHPWLIDWSMERALTQARVASSALSRVADSLVDEIARSLSSARQAGATDEQIAETLAEHADFDGVSELIEHVYRLQLRSAMWRRLAGTDSDELGTVDGAVGFVDLVGYTALAEELADDELAALVQRFIDVAHDTVVAAGGRIVKTIGDEVMYVTDTVPTAALIAVQLTERSRGDELLPQTRAGIAAGRLVAREGDYYGPVVNLAARLTELARPGSVLAPAEVGTAIDGDSRFRIRRIASRRVRDIGRVELCVVDGGAT
jgi:adenylate cyclase